MKRAKGKILSFTIVFLLLVLCATYSLPWKEGTHKNKLTQAALNLIKSIYDGKGVYTKEIWNEYAQYIKFSYSPGTDISGADFTGTKMRDVKNLKVEQLSRARTFYQAHMSEYLESLLKKNCPDLLKQPSDEK